MRIAMASSELVLPTLMSVFVPLWQWPPEDEESIVALALICSKSTHLCHASGQDLDTLGASDLKHFSIFQKKCSLQPHLNALIAATRVRVAEQP